MKKSKTKDQEQTWKLRRLRLNRETIGVLDDPALLELARGGSDSHELPSCTGISNSPNGCAIGPNTSRP